MFFVTVSSMITQDIEGSNAAPKINEEMISFPPLHVYSHLGKNPTYIKSFKYGKLVSGNFIHNKDSVPESARVSAPPQTFALKD